MQKRLCMISKENKQDWEFHYNKIEGFNYQWGYDYHLQIKRKRVLFPMQDASSYSEELIEILSQTKSLENSFDLLLSADILYLENTSFFLTDGSEIFFPKQELYEDFIKEFKTQKEFKGRFLVDYGKNKILFNNIIP